MRQNKELQLIAASVVSESELSKGAKLQLIKFIQYEATDVQVKAILLDGKILTNIDEQTAEIINDRFAVSEAGGRVAKLRKTSMGMLGVNAGSVLWLAYRKIRSMKDACTKKCGTYEYNTSRRQHCIIQCRVAEAKAKLAAAQKAKNDSEVKKMKAKLAKANETLRKSTASFKSRGAQS